MIKNEHYMVLIIEKLVTIITYVILKIYEIYIYDTQY